MAQKLMTPEEVAEILGVKPQTLSVWRSRGRYGLPYVKSGSLVRYREADVQAFIESRLNANPSPDKSDLKLGRGGR
jgi:excisionase family DNA binding protein